jgi:hypothetical protein
MQMRKIGYALCCDADLGWRASREEIDMRFVPALSLPTVYGETMSHGPYFHVTQNEKEMCEICYKDRHSAVYGETMRMTDSPLDCAMALSKQELARQVVEGDDRNARLVAALPEILKFLNSIEGEGYGGMASFEIARMHVRAAIQQSTEKP